MYEVIEEIIQDEIKLIQAVKHRCGGGTDAYDIGHYQGVIDGQIKAYEKILTDIRIERGKADPGHDRPVQQGDKYRCVLCEKKVSGDLNGGNGNPICSDCYGDVYTESGIRL